MTQRWLSTAGMEGVQMAHADPVSVGNPSSNVGAFATPLAIERGYKWSWAHWGWGFTGGHCLTASRGYQRAGLGVSTAVSVLKITFMAWAGEVLSIICCTKTWLSLVGYGYGLYLCCPALCVLALLCPWELFFCVEPWYQRVGLSYQPFTADTA